MVKTDFLKRTGYGKKLVRVGFFLFLLILFLQLFFSLRFTEPYPALLLPSFGYVPDNEQQFNYQVADISAYIGNNKIEIPSEQDLFPTMPPVYSTILSRKLFSEHSFLINPVPDTAYRELYLGIFLIKVNRRSLPPEQKNRETRRYLQERINDFTGGREADSLLFILHEIHWNLEKETIDTVQSRRYEIIFDE